MEKPTAKQRFASFGKFIYNSEEGSILGRGAKSWAEIGFFYLIYYICLSGFFIATIAVFYQTLEDDQPKLQGSSSLLKGNPGLAIRPRSLGSTNSITVKTSDSDSYVKGMNEILDPYRESLRNTPCMKPEPRPTEKVPCAFDLQATESACSESNGYGVKDGNPCVILRLNKVFGWTPELWQDASDLDDSGFPEDLKSNYTNTHVMVQCKGRKDEDVQKLNDVDVTYHPDQGFPVNFFPFKKMDDYRQPLVFVKFNNMPKDTSIKIECRAYAKNIHFDRTEKQGGTEFELKVVD